ncbi:phage major capsid protein, P2 family [Canicola haemoglobinophilus]|uniref:P2 family phage major capsid protein n=1 Tax=Canicola haemoglobinophilus TaxID=733 RepID=A0A1V4B179_9PAST|nr:phage major capsid protein, P2 family [Canicola haemoglobinophilus]OOS00659.1 phage major capsid protein, P2 family [Canicola haemoglobinophilus]STO54350.1 P2 family phage major capsid protein [Canicola haemoglobinophilus]STO60181.1 P2 family phage major capsid protein [Canicola haemoglobinophilus]STO68884.1 P2 family phage major capsid protein [Canicola haemoglobinophilus]
MKKTTAVTLMNYLQGISQDNKEDFSRIAMGAKFTVEPSVQQRLENAVQESSDFLKLINIVPVDEQQGEILGLGVAGTIAGTTDTNSAGRKTQAIHALSKIPYHCQQINYDTHLKYATLDMWAKFPDFAKRIGALKAERMALDRIMIGFNGTSRAATSNRVSNPLLQDVAVGWLKKIEDNAPERVMKEETRDSGKIEVGEGKTYKNLDALVFSAVSDLIAPQFQDDTKLVAIMSRDLLADKYFPLVNQSKASEQVSGDIIMSTKRVGGLPAVQAPFVPKGTILITRLDNLSIYYQSGAMRRTLKDNAEYDRYEDYTSSNDDFVVENYESVALLKNIKMVDAPQGDS